MAHKQSEQLNKPGDPILVYTPQAFSQMLQHLRQHPCFALDTESDSLYSYYPKVCLIQISTYATAPEEKAKDHTQNSAEERPIVDYLVDPVRLPEVHGLNALLADPQMEVVLHAAENDILTLQRDFNFTFSAVFDTQLAARILGWKRVGLAKILEDQFGVISDKRMQLTDWGKRPLTPQQLTYAQMDTHYLLALRLRQINALKEMGRWREAQDAFQTLVQVEYQERTPEERTVWQMKETQSVEREQTGMLEALWLWREQEAQHQNRPPFKIMANGLLVALTKRQPRSLRDLQKIRSLGKEQVARYGQALLSAIQEGRERPLPEFPKSKRNDFRLDDLTQTRYDALRSWRTQMAEKRDVAPEIIFSNQQLLQIARHAPQSTAALQELLQVGTWKVETYGTAILDLLAEAVT